MPHWYLPGRRGYSNDNTEDNCPRKRRGGNIIAKDPARGDGARCVFALADPTAEPGGAKKGDRLVAKNPHLKVTAPAKRGHAKLP